MNLIALTMDSQLPLPLPRIQTYLYKYFTKAQDALGTYWNKQVCSLWHMDL